MADECVTRGPAERAGLTIAEEIDLRSAFERDKWAGEWNSLPTAVARVVAERTRAAEEQAGAAALRKAADLLEFTADPPHVPTWLRTMARDAEAARADLSAATTDPGFGSTSVPKSRETGAEGAREGNEG